MLKTAILALWLGLALVRPTLAAEREVQIGDGNSALHGTLLTPASPRPGPAVLLLSGSGPTDRNGNSTAPGVKPANMRLLAEGLAARSIASLRVDKRGAGASLAAMPEESRLRVSTYAEDAVAWIRFLAAQPGVSCVVLVGHSEGALIATLAAEQTPVCGLVSFAGAGRPAGVVIAEQLRAAAPEPLRSQALATLAELTAGRTVKNPALPSLFRPSVQPYMISLLAIDPAAELAKVKAPVLLLQGDHDIQVSLADARRLAAFRPGADLVILPGVSHMMKQAPADRAGNAATYADPSLPLDPAVVAEIGDFVRGVKP